MCNKAKLLATTLNLQLYIKTWVVWFGKVATM